MNSPHQVCLAQENKQITAALYAHSLNFSISSVAIQAPSPCLSCANAGRIACDSHTQTAAVAGICLFSPFLSHTIR